MDCQLIQKIFIVLKVVLFSTQFYLVAIAEPDPSQEPIVFISTTFEEKNVADLAEIETHLVRKNKLSYRQAWSEAQKRVEEYLWNLLDLIQSKNSHIFNQKKSINLRKVICQFDNRQITLFSLLNIFSKILENFDSNLRESSPEELISVWKNKRFIHPDQVVSLNHSIITPVGGRKSREEILQNLYLLLYEAIEKDNKLKNTLIQLFRYRVILSSDLWNLTYQVNIDQISRIKNLKEIFSLYIEFLNSTASSRISYKDYKLLSLGLNALQSYKKDLIPIDSSETHSHSISPLVAPSSGEFTRTGFNHLFRILDSILKTDAIFLNAETNLPDPQKIIYSHSLLQRRYLLQYGDNVTEISLRGLLKQYLNLANKKENLEFSSPISIAKILDLWRMTSHHLTKENKPIEWIDIPIDFDRPSLESSVNERMEFIFQILDAIVFYDPQFKNEKNEPDSNRLKTYDADKNVIRYYRFNQKKYFSLDYLLRELGKLAHQNEQDLSRGEIISAWKLHRQGMILRTFIEIPIPILIMNTGNEITPSLNKEDIFHNLYKILEQILIKTPTFHSRHGRPLLSLFSRQYVETSTIKYAYQFPNSRLPYTFEGLLRKYADHLNRITDQETNSQYYTIDRLIRMWKRVTQDKPELSHHLKEEDVKLVISQYNLEPLLHLFADSPDLLLSAIRFTHKNIESELNLSRFHLNFLKWERTNDFFKQEKSAQKKFEKNLLPHKTSKEWNNKRMNYLFYVLEQSQQGHINFLEKLYADQVRIFQELCREEWSENPPSFLEKIKKEKIRINEIIVKNYLSLNSDTHLKAEAKKILIYLQKIYDEVLHYYESITSFTLPQVKIPPYLLQIEGAHYLTTHPIALVADDTGIGKTWEALVAAESLIEKNQISRVLYVTTSNTKTQVESWIRDGTYTTPEQLFILDSTEKGTQLYEILRQQEKYPIKIKYILITYEILWRLAKFHQSIFDQILSHIDLSIVDEGHLFDNSETMRSQAINQIKSPWRWVLTASPYQHHPQRFWTILNYLDPKTFPNQKDFIRFYLRDEDGLEELRMLLRKFMLRRSKNQLEYFRVPTKKQEEHFQSNPSAKIQFYQEQLRNIRNGKIPELIDLNEHQPGIGQYSLTAEQTEEIIRLAQDRLSQSAEISTAPKKTFDFIYSSKIRRVIYDPTSIGLNENEEFYNNLDQVVEDRMKKNEKIILFAYNVKVIEKLKLRYELYGAKSYYGQTSPEQKEKIRKEMFDLNSSTRILVANYMSIKEGLSFPSVSTIVFVQIPDGFTRFFQTRGRHQRMIGASQIQFAKPYVYSIIMTPVYHRGVIMKYKSLVNHQQLDSFYSDSENLGLSDLYSSTLHFLEQGTIIQQMIKNISLGKIIFEKIMNGFALPSQLEEVMQNGIITSVKIEGFLHDQIDENKISINNTGLSCQSTFTHPQ